MATIDDWSEAQLRRLYRDVMAKGDPFKESPHAHKSQTDLVIEMDSADEVMADMSMEIGRLEVAITAHVKRWRRTLWFFGAAMALVPVAFLAGRWT